MKHIVYTCLRCGKQATTTPDNDTVPPEWAKIHYERYHTVAQDQMRTSLESHACADCAKGVLDYLEPPSKTAPRLESV